ncbi:trehalose synthase [Kwoniella mangroviensis CBS 10435]|uniref:Trehalose synthase n=1 Tax=Kwoniella mangroviensis CBS 10435 TaxID=1331196 RepID=A0A1B9J153_9TREE|nr:trehalose synthase [Kwoniella mangroviensis CBS 10435]OCF77536.1 trehalose synthase [Kwoniella mangroviensis CBS 8886]
MSPHRKLCISSKRHPTQIQDIFLGLALSLSPQPTDRKPDGSDPGRELEYSAVLHDGTGVVESETFHTRYYSHGKEGDDLAEENKRIGREVLGLIRSIQTDKGMNVRMVAVADPVPQEFKGHQGVQFFSTLWLHVDVIPILVTPSTSIFTKLPAPSTSASATAAISAGVKHLHPATHSATTADVDPVDHSVQVDCDGQVKLCSIVQYKESTSEALWDRFTALADHLVKNNISISFFSATPQGGGVALMRHAMIRLWRMVGLNVKWYVPEGHPTVFDITKRKFHNVLQGVAPQDMDLTDEDKKWFELWTEQNYESFWSNGAIDASIIVIDDPQLTALIPIIKKKRPDAKIIFRSHIQIQSDLTNDPQTMQHRTWNYLFDFIKDVDLFLAHPVKFFVPKNVHETLPVLYMAPSTDPLDGLNKPYGRASVRYFRQYFNQLSLQQCGVHIDWDRGYVCQIARFDPSKGIDDLVAAYLQFRKKLENSAKPPVDGGPQLIIMGHGSVDDPDGSWIYEKLHDTLGTKEYALVRDDVAVVRAPPSDSILGCILQGAWVATQLSTREGFEVKVTEAVNKRVPIIASDAGGIPLQVKHGKNGWIVPTGDRSAVANLLYDIWEGKVSVHRDLSGANRDLDGKTDPNSIAQAWVGDFDKEAQKVHADEGATSEDFWTVGNSTRWMLLFDRLLGLSPEDNVSQPPNANGKETTLGNEEEFGKVKITEKQVGLLKSMEIGKKLNDKGIDGVNVWEMLMGNDMIKGEGELI